MATIHRKSKSGTWYVLYRENGKQIHRSLGTKSVRKAQILKRELELMLAEQGHAELVVSDQPAPRRRNPTVEEFWETFLPWAEAHRSRVTVEEYRTWFAQFSKFAHIKRLGDATRENVEKFKAKLRRQGQRKPNGVGLNVVSINNGLKTLKAIWNHASKLELYTGENPFAQVEPYPLPRNIDRDYLTPEQIDKLLEACDVYAKEKYVRRLESRNVKIAIALMAFAGLRKREVCYARWEWIQWDKKLLVVSNHAEFTTKNKRSRIISMHERLITVLAAHRKENGYVLESLRCNEGKAKYRAEFRKSFDRVCKTAAIEATPHDLRHSFASRQAVRGRSLHVIAGWLGHSTTWMTERYAHFQQEYVADINDM